MCVYPTNTFYLHQFMNFTNYIKDIMFKIDVSDVTLYMHMHFKSTM